MFTKLNYVLPIPFLLVILLVLSSGCSISNANRSPEQTDMNPETPMATLSEVNATSPNKPDRLAGVPVPASAEWTAAELLKAEHFPVDRYRLAKEISQLPELQLMVDIPEELGFVVNDRHNFIVSNNAKFYTEPARLRCISDNAYWWTNLKARVDDADIAAAAYRFENEVLKINQLIFGKEWSPGIDNDRRFHILLVNDQNWKRYGYFTSINEYPLSMQPNSNQKEMIVLRLNEVDLDSLTFAGRLAHEYQHLIHWNLDPNEDLWLNEGMSELAYYLSGAPPVTMYRNNAKYFAQMPYIQLTSWPERSFGGDDHSTLAQYGAVKQFMVYLFEQFGAQFIKDVSNNPKPGVISIQEELDRLPNQPQFNDVFANWLVAKFVNRPQISQGQFGYNDFPLKYYPSQEVIRSINGKPLVDQLPPYGARYYLIESQEPVKVSFSGSTLARLTPADPPTGDYVWYSNRGDESDFSLTRSFDLTDLDSATLEYRIWYQLDNLYDYAYVEASPNRGRTWEILTTGYGTDSNPRGQALGFGYTGSTTEWLSESINLNPYTGQEIIIRFQLITDFTTNRDGIQLDDIAIPELGYFDSAEDESGGWDAQGFIRSSNLVPAEWIVWLVKASNPMQVERISLSSAQMAEFEIEGLGEQFNVAAVVISPTAPTTTMELDYELVFQHP